MSSEEILVAVVEAALAAPRRRPLMVGLCGAQGSGKSTLAASLVRRIPHAVTLSLDDFYLTLAERRRLAADAHPLFETRGVPGTHDVALALATFAALDRGEAIHLPRFDKATDDRFDAASWPIAPPGCRLIIFEGWCVGARPQPDEALAVPVNQLERERDGDALWRRHANQALMDYQQLFARLDMLTLLRAPDWDTVFGWRLEQEHALRRSAGAGVAVMSDSSVATFVSHYERLTRYIHDEMPERADLVLQLAGDRSCVSVQRAPV